MNYIDNSDVVDQDAPLNTSQQFPDDDEEEEEDLVDDAVALCASDDIDGQLDSELLASPGVYA